MKRLRRAICCSCPAPWSPLSCLPLWFLAVSMAVQNFEIGKMRVEAPFLSAAPSQKNWLQWSLTLHMRVTNGLDIDFSLNISKGELKRRATFFQNYYIAFPVGTATGTCGLSPSIQVPVKNLSYPSSWLHFIIYDAIFQASPIHLVRRPEFLVNTCRNGFLLLFTVKGLKNEGTIHNDKSNMRSS